MDGSHALGSLLEVTGGVASSSDLARLGLGPPDIKRLVGVGRLHRLRRGTFIDGPAWQEAPPWERHTLRARAVARALCGPGSPYLLSHHSALSVRGIGSHGVDDRVHLVRTDGARGRADSILHIHPAVTRDWAITTQTDAGSGAPPLPMVKPALACVQVAAAFGPESGLVSADEALREGVITATQLGEAAQTIPGRGSPAVRQMLELADGRSGSAGESRTRWMLHWLGLPAPELQAVVRDHSGTLVAVTDFLFRDEWTVVEFDGALKYSSRDDLVAEKHREDRLRELGFEVVRVSWADLEHPARVVARIRAAFARSAARRSRSA